MNSDSVHYSPLLNGSLSNSVSPRLGIKSQAYTMLWGGYRALLSAFGYAGEWVDSVTGYTYLRMRWLDTETGTFLSEDPLVQTTNSAFGYTEGNPITQIDPLGLMPGGMTPVLSPEQSEEMAEGVLTALEWTRKNSGWISAGFGLAAVLSVATGVGVPLAPFLGAAGMLFGAVSLEYELANCIGYTKDKRCDPGAVTLSLVGMTSGGLGLLGGKIWVGASRAIDFENAGVVAGALGVVMSGVVVTIDQLSNSKIKEQC